MTQKYFSIYLFTQKKFECIEAKEIRLVNYKQLLKIKIIKLINNVEANIKKILDSKSQNIDKYINVSSYIFEVLQFTKCLLLSAYSTFPPPIKKPPDIYLNIKSVICNPYLDT